ncbi:MAG: trypsin-like peptidase domain-containing protein [Cyanobacteria bacterium HKST-UBA04]|nr:trypsin-like peptidase domain-containing protein [Cyanobacteria bacterium HKST-UBA04]
MNPHPPALHPQWFNRKQPGKTLSVWLAGGACLLSLGALGISLNQVNHPVALNFSPQQPAHTNQLVANPQDMKLFSTSSNLIADVAEEVAPSVVNIDITKQGRTRVVPNPFHDEFFQRFFGVQPQYFSQQQPTVRGNGSGVVISKEGHILTNNHVINGADEMVVTLNDGRKVPAHLIGQDPLTDLAIIQIEGVANLKPAQIGDSDKIRPGEWVIAVGSPLGFDHTVTLGIISALSRQVPDINNNVEFIQTDAAINPGNSGGPLVNLRGEVVGINTAISGVGQNIGFAIPANTIKDVSKQLISAGNVVRPWIGISMTDLNPQLAQSLGLSPSTNGIVVAQVFPNSPAQRAGFRQGDVIQRVDGQALDDSKDLQKLIRSKPLNSTMNFQILRNGQMNALSLTTEKLPEQALSQPQQQQ